FLTGCPPLRASVLTAPSVCSLVCMWCFTSRMVRRWNFPGCGIKKYHLDFIYLKVAFSASLSGGESGHTGPYSTDVTLVYKHIFTNIGHAYNPATGFFTAPVRGVYHFRFSLYGGGGRPATVVLHKNGHLIAGTHSVQPQGTVSSSNGVSLSLEVGDVICIKLNANAWIFDDSFHHSTFSGQMLFSF
uniref:C1q domain-containing protein n=1 Tax=Pygocentrus nattereri TaxID=42514 RepID=A0A3B4DPA6_PYGNA